MEIDASKVVSRIRANKWWIVVALVALFVVYSFLSALLGSSGSRAMYSEGLAAQKSMNYAPSYDRAESYAPQSTGASASNPVVKRASLSVKSRDAKADESKVTDRVRSLGGFVEGVSDSDSEDYVTVTISVKVPSSKFEEFVDYLRDSFKVESSSIDLYRISLKQEGDEIAILQKTMDAYNALFDKAEKQSTLDAQTLVFMADITNRKLDVMRMMRQYGYSLESKQEDVDFSTLTLTLREEKPVELVKEGFWSDFRRQLRNAIDNILDTLIGMVTDTLVLFVYVVKLGLILIVLAIPVKYILKALGRIFDVHFSSSPKGAPALSEVYPPAAGAKRSR